jgi:flagella basal body P-ring formation protein FlgA
MKNFIYLTLLIALGAAPVHAQVSQGQLAQAMTDSIESHPDIIPGSRIELSHVRAASAGLLARARGVQRIELAKGQDPIGLITARVWLDVPSDPGVWTWVRARSHALVPTVITIRDVKRGATLTRADVEVVHKSPHPRAHSEPSQVVGKRTRRQLESGEVVLASWIDVPPLVQRGDHIEAAIQNGGLRVRAPAIALERGASGEVIRLKIPTTGRVVQGRILSAKQVEVLR